MRCVVPTGLQDHLEERPAAAGLAAGLNQRERRCLVTREQATPGKHHIDLGGARGDCLRGLCRGGLHIRLAGGEIGDRRHRHHGSREALSGIRNQPRPGAQRGHVTHGRRRVRGQSADHLGVIGVVERREVEHAEQPAGQGRVLVGIRHHGAGAAGAGPQLTVICRVAAL